MGLHDHGRDKRGRFTKGTSGNPCGRPRKVTEVPKDMRFVLAEELEREAEFTDAGGKRRKGTQYEMIAARIVSEAARAKPKEALSILERLDKLGAINTMRAFREFDPEKVAAAARSFLEQHEIAGMQAKALSEFAAGDGLSSETLAFLGITPPEDAGP